MQSGIAQALVASPTYAHAKSDDMRELPAVATYRPARAKLESASSFTANDQQGGQQLTGVLRCLHYPLIRYSLVRHSKLGLRIEEEYTYRLSH